MSICCPALKASNAPRRGWSGHSSEPTRIDAGLAALLGRRAWQPLQIRTRCQVGPMPPGTVLGWCDTAAAYVAPPGLDAVVLAFQARNVSRYEPV
jgi:hypothetical protein